MLLSSGRGPRATPRRQTALLPTHPSSQKGFRLCRLMTSRTGVWLHGLDENAHGQIFQVLRKFCLLMYEQSAASLNCQRSNGFTPRNIQHHFLSLGSSALCQIKKKRKKKLVQFISFLSVVPFSFLCKVVAFVPLIVDDSNSL